MQQLRNTAVQYDMNQNAFHQLNQKYDKLNQQNVDLNQKYNIAIEYHHRDDSAYWELEKNFKQLQFNLNGAVQNC